MGNIGSATSVSRVPMEMYAWTYEHVLYPAWQKFVNGRGIEEYRRELETSQWLPPEAHAARQAAELRSLLEDAKATPYYREVFAKAGLDPRDVRSRDDLKALPLLTRDIVHERYADLLHPERGATIKKGTSGTSGRPMQFEYSNESEAWRQALRLRGYGWAGYHHGLPVLHLWARQATPPEGLSAVKVKVDRALRRELYLDSTQQDEVSLRHAVEHVQRMQPRVIIGYSKATALLAQFIVDHRLATWSPDIPVICAAEPLLDTDRLVIEKVFGPTFNTYGSRETMLVAAECAAHDGMHLSEENLIVEVLEKGVDAPPGTPGQVVITDLHNRAMPLIRYVNGDLATMASGSCACGRGLRRLARIEGRSCDTLHDSGGNPIPGMAFIAMLARADDAVRQFQVLQKKSGEVVLKFVPGRDFKDDILSTLCGRFRERLGDLPVTVERCASIPASASGKLRPVIVE